MTDAPLDYFLTPDDRHFFDETAVKYEKAKSWDAWSDVVSGYLSEMSVPLRVALTLKCIEQNAPDLIIERHFQSLSTIDCRSPSPVSNSTGQPIGQDILRKLITVKNDEMGELFARTHFTSSDTTKEITSLEGAIRRGLVKTTCALLKKLINDMDEAEKKTCISHLCALNMTAPARIILDSGYVPDKSEMADLLLYAVVNRKTDFALMLTDFSARLPTSEIARMRKDVHELNKDSDHVLGILSLLNVLELKNKDDRRSLRAQFLKAKRKEEKTVRETRKIATSTPIKFRLRK